MKRLIILSLTLLFVFAVIQGRSLKSKGTPLKKLLGTEVSINAKNAFAEQFGNIPNVQWKRIMNFDVVAFTKDSKEMKAYFDSDAKLVGTTQKKTFEDLPVKGQQEIKSKYKDYTPGQIVKFDDNELNDTDMVLYSTQFAAVDTYFVELTKNSDKIVVQVLMDGKITLFKKI